MADNIAIWLAWGSLISSVLPLVFFYKSWSNLKRLPYLLISIYFVLKVFFNSLSAFLYYAGIDLPFNISPFFAFNGDIFLMSFFLLINDKFKKIFFIIIVLILILNISLFYFLKKIGDFDIGNTVALFFWVIMAIIQLFQLNTSNIKVRLSTQPNFWFSLAVLCSGVIGIITNVLGDLLKNYNNAYPFNVLALANFYAICSNILYAIGVYKLHSFTTKTKLK
jgi:hypothetical protein